ncbi:MAG: PPK2 family polyphosphate kinase [Actinomycetota bacterium]
MASESASVRDALRVAPGTVNLAGYDTASTPLAPGKKAKTEQDADDNKPLLAELQERLHAEASAGGQRSVLLVLQGIDTAGKGGVVDHVVSAFGPAGVRYTAFKKPTPEEQAHHFLWRIRKALPSPGAIGVFDRSHYEDVLVPRVHETIPEADWQRRYVEINDFETELAASGTTVMKCYLHISYAMQRERLLARLDDPTKHWKFRETDIDERAFWSDYQAAYTAMLQHCSSPAAPWYIVPSDHKWYRNWAIGRLMTETLQELGPRYPEGDLDLDRLRRRLQPPY